MRSKNKSETFWSTEARSFNNKLVRTFIQSPYRLYIKASFVAELDEPRVCQLLLITPHHPLDGNFGH